MKFALFCIALVCWPSCTSFVLADDVIIHQVFQHEKQSHFPAPQVEIEFHIRKKIDDKYINRGPIFVGDSEAGDDKIRLYRWHHPESDLYFVGFEIPPGIQGLRVDTFEVYVWKKAAEGLTPVFCSVAPNGTDAYFTMDPEEHKQKIVDDWKSKKVRRRNLKTVFFAKPTPQKTPTP